MIINNSNSSVDNTATMLFELLKSRLSQSDRDILDNVAKLTEQISSGSLVEHFTSNHDVAEEFYRSLSDRFGVVTSTR